MKRIGMILLVSSCAFGGGWAAVLIPRWQSPAQAQATLSQGGLSSASEVLRVSERFEAVARLVSPAVVYVEATKSSGPARSLPYSAPRIVARSTLSAV